MERKKIMSLFALGCGVLLITGCGTDNDKNEEKAKKSNTETISCVAEEKASGMITTASTEFTYDKKEKKLVSGNLVMGIDYTDLVANLTAAEKESAESIMKNSFEEMCDEFEGKGYTNCKTKFVDSSFEMSVDFDMKRLDEATDGDLDVEMTIEELKEYFEDTDGAKCTIK